MKYWTYLVLLTIYSCNTQQQKVGSYDTLVNAPPSSVTDIKIQNDNEIYWTGTLNAKTPVFLHYKVGNNLIIGEITDYLT